MFRASCWLLLLLAAETGLAQVSGYASATYGYQANPLYNYQRISDRVAQTYLELTYQKEYETSSLQAQYLSGLMVFNKLNARNYYEHSLGLHYRLQLSPQPGEEEASAEEPTASTLAGMTRGRALLLSLKGSARHDRSVYREYDNASVSFITSYSSGSKELFLILSNRAEYRSYTYLPELSNLTDVLSARLVLSPEAHTAYGLMGGIGIKQFTIDAVDTVQFTTGGGKGKSKNGLVGQGSSKKIMTNEQTRSTAQAEIGLVGYRTWGRSSIEGFFRYRWNIGEDARYVAQVAGSTILSEDIYNDHFSYEGPEIEATYRQQLPLNVRASLKGTAARRTYGAPAFSLLGEQRAASRNDLHSALEFSLSRYFELTGALGLELTLSASALRNQSNDEYNDFSGYAISLGVGVGF